MRKLRGRIALLMHLKGIHVLELLLLEMMRRHGVGRKGVERCALLASMQSTV